MGHDETGLPAGVTRVGSVTLKDQASGLAWSASGRQLAVVASFREVVVVDPNGLRLAAYAGLYKSAAWLDEALLMGMGWGEIHRPASHQKIRVLGDSIRDLAYSATTRMLAGGADDARVYLIAPENLEVRRTLLGHRTWVLAVAFSPDGARLASGGGDDEVRIWDVASGATLRRLAGHRGSVTGVGWTADGRVVSCSFDESVRVWDATSGASVRTLRGHTSWVNSVAVSGDGRLLASQSADDTVRLWRTDTWETVAVLPDGGGEGYGGRVAFAPAAPLLAVAQGRHEGPNHLLLYRYDLDLLLGTPPAVRSVHYTSAKVTLVGESGAGKTCVARALMGEDFVPQESTHGMKLWPVHSETVADGPADVQRDTLLWDLAGQPDYQVVHQLFIDETSVALVLFDPTDPTDPFEGVHRWDKALRKIVGPDVTRVLVAGRVDRGAPTVTPADIEAHRVANGFAAYVPTSARTGEGIAALREIIARVIPWDRLPVTTSPELWKRLREYLVALRAGSEVLTRRTELRAGFAKENPEEPLDAAAFDTVLRNAAVQGLVWPLSFGDFVLLRPEVLNDYASAIVRVARKHPDGLGCVPERAVLDGRVAFEDLSRVPSATESVLLNAVVELFLRREVAVREGLQLVFPSKFNRKRPDQPVPPRRVVAYAFAGPVEDVYATLVVRLYYSNVYTRSDFYRAAAEFSDEAGLCGVQLDAQREGEGRLSVYFDDRVSEDSRLLFLRFVHEHLAARAIEGSLRRERIYRCPACHEEVTDRRAIEHRLAKGQPAMPCGYCDAPVTLVDRVEKRFGDAALLARVREMEAEITARRDEAVGVTQAAAKEAVKEFDVFLAHRSGDKPQVLALADALRRRGLNPWVDAEQIPPGRWWMEVIEQAVTTVRSAAIVLGPGGLGKWEAVELRAFVQQCVERDVPVIPVLLPGVGAIPANLPFLKTLHSVTFTAEMDDVDALDHLQWGITGTRPERLDRKLR